MKTRLAPLHLLVAVVVLWAIPSVAGTAFEPTTFEAFERLRPAPESVNGFQIDASRPGLHVVVSQACEVRALHAEKKVFMEQLGMALGAAELFAEYTRELNVTERGLSRWIPFQDATIDHLLSRPCQASEIAITVRHLAVHSELGLIYGGIGYSLNNLQRPKRATCFAQELLGVEIGMPLQEARASLVERFGQEREFPRVGQRRLWGYPADTDHDTTLIVGDSGSGSRKNVFSIQVWGPPNPDLELGRGLRLGQSASVVEELLGAPASRKPSSDGFEVLRFEGTPCSVELRDGVLASVLILGDPNYFED